YCAACAGLPSMTAPSGMEPMPLSPAFNNRLSASRALELEWILRVGAFMCFVGHGAFGIITKEAWVPYFGVVGIDRHTAFQLMPLVGTVDIAMGFLMLLRPLPAVAYWMAAWAVWTALLRPLSGEPSWEAIERAGNYGVPAALALLMITPSTLSGI